MDTATPVIITESGVDQDTTTVVPDDDGQADFEDWFCVKTDPFPCPAEGCEFVASFMTAAHLIVVWPRDDDPALLGAASNAREVGRNPRVVKYRDDMGRAISWDQWAQSGQRVHGVEARPEGWEGRPWRI